MRRLLVVLAALIAMTTATVAPAGAITGAFVDDYEHPFVGLVVFYDADGAFVGRCSGSLLTPTVFLTAAHCVEGAETARIYFQQDAGAKYDPTTGVDPVTGYPETCAPGTLGINCATSDQLYDYDYDGLTFPDTHDVALVILDQPIFLPEYGSLATAGTLDRLATRRGTQETTFTVSGYGLTYKTVDPTKTVSYRERLMAISKLTNLRSALTDGFNLQTNGNGSGRGGTCNGDSGGPVFLGGYDSNIIVAVTSFGLNRLCRGSDFAYRTDQAAVIQWIVATVDASGTQYQDITFVTL